MTTPHKTAAVELPSDREVVIIRDFEAPRELVFDVWTTPEHVRNWYASNEGPLHTCEIDLRPGGTWRYVLLEADGSEIAFSGEYREVVRPERLVYTEGFEPIPGPPAVVTVLFTEYAGRTRLTSTSLYPTLEVRDGHLQSGMEQGVEPAMAHIDAILSTLD